MIQLIDSVYAFEQIIVKDMCFVHMNRFSVNKRVVIVAFFVLSFDKKKSRLSDCTTIESAVNVKLIAADMILWGTFIHNFQVTNDLYNSRYCNSLN